MKRLPLKTAYYLSFASLIVIPLLLVLAVALTVLNRQFKSQAVENIRQAQETIITELKSDMDIMSMRLAQLINTNNNEILSYAAETDTADGKTRYEYEKKLQQMGNLVLEPIKDIISVGFYMKDGRKTFIKNEIKYTTEEIRQTGWYQNALKKKNIVCVGSYDTQKLNDLYVGGKKDLLILVFALAPDVATDRSQKIEMVVFYQSTDAAERIQEYNRGYLQGKNKLGITQIRDSEGNIIFSTVEEDFRLAGAGYTCVETALELYDTSWYVESYIRTKDLTREYLGTVLWILAVAVLIFVLAARYYSYFLHNIVRPAEEISGGLKQIEEGNLDVHISVMGQSEIRDMIHQFNAMARRIKALVGEYEARVRSVELRPGDYFGMMVRQEMTPSEVNHRSRDFFAEQYAILGFCIENMGRLDSTTEAASSLAAVFEKNPRYAARCMTYIESPSFIISFYRITEEEYQTKVLHMIQEIQKTALKESGVVFSVCIERKAYGPDAFTDRVEGVRKKICFRYICGGMSIINLSAVGEGQDKRILDMAEQYEKLAKALCTADEKNITEEKEKLFSEISGQNIGLAKTYVFAVILAIGKRFQQDNASLGDVFGQEYNYVEKLQHVEDERSLKLWVTNFLAWLMDYSASKLRVMETDVIVRAKRYIADNYDDADLSLAKVAEYVELSEKYFTGRFTKETGETFSTYLTSLRMQKAKELLKTTTFKIYEISEMVGYHNVEHFNRVFKKFNDITPAKYRKTM